MSKTDKGVVFFPIYFLLFSLQEKAHDGVNTLFSFLRFVCRIHQSTAAGEAATGAAGVDRAGMAGNEGRDRLAFCLKREASMLTKAWHPLRQKIE